MAGVVQSVIYNEGVPILTQETIDYIKNKTQSLLQEVDTWLVRASQYKSLDNQAFTISKKIVDQNGNKSYQSVNASGINFLGDENKDFSLKNQFQALNKIIRNRQIDAANISLESLLKDGYRILTQLGEALRGDEVRYQIYIHDGSSMGLINKVDKFNLNLEDFLGHGVRVDYKTGELKVAGIKSLKNSKNPNQVTLKGAKVDLNALNLFIKELKGYFLFAGRHRRNVLKDFGDELAETVKTINLGHVFETAANYYPGLLDQTISLENDITNALSWQAITEAENYWKSFDENAKEAFPRINADIKKIAAIFETLKDPSPFWQGGEGGPGLANIQVKASRASVTTLHSLVRQMVRVSSIYHKISYSRVKGEIVANMSKEDYDEEVVMGLLKMFDRRFTGHYQWNINF